MSSVSTSKTAISTQPILPLPPLTDAQKSRKVEREIVETEKSYHSRLIVIETLFMNPLKDILEEEDYSSLFSLIPPLIKSSSHLLKEIEESKHSLSQILLNFLTKHSTPLRTFCVHHQEIMASVTRLLTNNDLFYKFSTVTLSNPFCHGLDLQSYLLEPVQRVSRYPLLLKELLHYTPKTATTEKEHHQMIMALEAAELFVHATNEAVREDEAEKTLKLRLRQIKADDHKDTTTTTLSALISGVTRKNRKRLLKTEIRLIKMAGFSKTKILCILLSDVLLLLEVQNASSSWKAGDECNFSGGGSNATTINEHLPSEDMDELTLHKEPMILDDIAIVGCSTSNPIASKPLIEIRRRNGAKLTFACLSLEERASFIKVFNQTKNEITSNISDLSEIKVPLCLPSCGTLLVEIRGLRNGDDNYDADVQYISSERKSGELYIIMQLNDQLIQLDRSLEGRWNIAHVLSMRSLDDHITFKVLEYDAWGPPVLIGREDMRLDLLEYYGEKMTEPMFLRINRALELEVLLQYRSFR